MKDYKVVYIDRNFIDDRYPNKPSDGNSFYTYGWSSLSAREFKKYNQDITVECWKADPRIKTSREKEIQGVYYRMFPSLNLGKLGQYSIRMKKHLKEWLKVNASTIFYISSFDHVLFYSIALNLKNYPLVVQNHGEGTAIHHLKKREGLSVLKAWIEQFPQNHSFRNLDLLFVLDNRLKKFIPSWYSRDRIIKRTTGVDPELFPLIPKIEAQRMLGLSSDKFYILYIGRLNKTKRPDLLIKAYLTLTKEFQDIELILGGFSREDEFFDLASESGALLVEGSILQTEIHKYLNASHVYVLAKLSDNHKYAGIGMLPVQALLCETPLVGESVHNLPDEIRESCGIYTDNLQDLIQSLRRIYLKEDSFADLRKKVITYYSWENISKQTKLDYDLLANRYFKT